MFSYRLGHKDVFIRSFNQTQMNFLALKSLLCRVNVVYLQTDSFNQTKRKGKFMTDITQEEARHRWNNVFSQRKETIEWMKQTLTKMYEKEHGVKPQGIEVW